MAKLHHNSRVMPHTPGTELKDAEYLDLRVVSADNLECPRRWSGRPIKVHAEVRLDGGEVEKSEADVAGGTNPRWNFDKHYSITPSVLERGGKLTVRVCYKRSVGVHWCIGENEICLKQLLETWIESHKETVTLTKDVLKHAKRRGQFTFSYTFRLHSFSV